MRDIIAIGAPVGGGTVLTQLVCCFPADLQASIFVVLHSTPENPILLADILNAPGRMRAAEAIDGERIERRRIYVAPEGKHLKIQHGRIHLSANGWQSPYRPALDVLFDSAAEAYDRRVIGVLLLHPREGGFAGLGAIRKAGGRAITHRNEQMLEEPSDPDTAEPLCDHHLDLQEIAPRVLAYVKEGNGSTDASLAR
jgi:two-component system, chemotaxis family, protein-glutamate methylesterase/glutaminase